MTTRSGPSRQPSLVSNAGSTAFGSPGQGPASQGSAIPTGATTLASPATPQNAASQLSNAAQRYRKLIWDATIPIAVNVEISSDLATTLASNGSAVDRSIETYYVRAPRISYLPLILQDVKANLLTIMLDDASLQTIKEGDYWFTFDGIPLRWHWPVGLLYDYHAVNMAPTVHTRGVQAAASAPTGLGGAVRRLSSQPGAGNGDASYFSTGAQLSSTADNAYVAPRAPLPWRITLHIGHAPLDKLHSAPGLDHCRSSFMSMVKEADFVRHGSTKRVVNLRRTEQDALWEGVLQHDFDMYWSVASKLVPNVPLSSTSSSTDAVASTRSGSFSLSRTPSIVSTATGDDISVDRTRSARPSIVEQNYNESQTSLYSAAPSESNISTAESAATTGKSVSTTGAAASGGNNTGSGHGYRSLPMRFHLVGGAPVVQEPVAPYTDDGRPVTLHVVLSALFPLLFPPTPTFSSVSTAAPPPPLAYAVVQGVRLPLDAEVPWIGAVLPSADGWVTVCIHLRAEGEKV